MTPGRRPPPAATRRPELADRLTAAEGLLVGLDFDGTLAPIETDPDRPVITPPARAAVARLVAHPDASVAVISGRALADLRHRVGLGEVIYAGNHGLEVDFGSNGTLVHPRAERQRPALEQVLVDLRGRLEAVPGVVIEDKGLTATVHVRRTPPERTSEVWDAVQAAVRRTDATLRIERGKEVVEVRPDVDWDKGDAIRLLADRVPRDWATLYLGDDVTDEDAFRVVRPFGVGILVGCRPGSDAAYRLATQSDVPAFLEWLVDTVVGPRPAVRS